MSKRASGKNFPCLLCDFVAPEAAKIYPSSTFFIRGKLEMPSKALRNLGF
jgi:hypothetical protein